MRVTDYVSPSPHARWYRQPVVWLAIALLTLAIVACIWMIVLGARHADEPLVGVGEQVFKMPLSRSAPKDGG